MGQDLGVDIEMPIAKEVFKLDSLADFDDWVEHMKRKGLLFIIAF